MDSKMKDIFEAFMRINFSHIKPTEPYYKEWEKRFNDGWEWQYSDYSNRRVLQNISPDIYPKDIDAYFRREKVIPAK